MLIGGALSGALALLAFALRGAKLYTGPGISLVSIILSGVPITVGLVATFLLRRAVEHDAFVTSAIAREFLRAQVALRTELISFGRYATVPGLSLGTLGWSNSTHRGSRAGGWLLAGIIALICAGSLAAQLRERPPPRYPLNRRALWNLAIAIDTRDCEKLTNTMSEGVSQIPSELAGWRSMADDCVLTELRQLEGARPNADWVERQRTLLASPLLLDEALRERVRTVEPGEYEWPAVPAADERTMEQVTAAITAVQRHVDRCFNELEVKEPIHLAFIIRRTGVAEFRETGMSLHPLAARCIVAALSWASLGQPTPVQVELEFRKSGR